jgi:hypothetical protein
MIGRQGERMVVADNGSGPPEGAVEVVRVLCLMQAGFLLLAGFGQVLMMGGAPAYLIAPVVKLVLLIVLAARVARGRRWAMITLIVLQVITLAGFTIQLAVGLLPQLDDTVNLVGLASDLALPAIVLALTAALLARTRTAPPVYYPVAVDPYAPAEILG